MLLRRSSVFVAVGLAVALAACVALVICGIRRGPWPADAPPAAGWPAGQSAPAEQPGLILPDVTGLAGPDAAGPHAGPAAGPYVKRLTVLVDKSGAASVAGMDSVRPWRGVDLPMYIGLSPGSSKPLPGLDELVVHLRADDGKVRILMRNWQTSDLAELGKVVAKVLDASGGKAPPTVIAAKPAVPFGYVVGTTAALMNLGIEVEFRPSTFGVEAGSEGVGGEDANKLVPLATAVRERIKAEAAKLTGPDHMSTLGVRIRADSRAPWVAVEAVAMECMKNCVWRISFAGFADGKEVVIGRVRSGAAPRSGPVLLDREEPLHEQRKRDIFKETKPVEPDAGGPESTVTDE